MATWRTADGHPGWLARLLISIAAAAAPLIIPFVVRFVAIEDPSGLNQVAHAGTIAFLILMILVWAMSVAATMYNSDKHVLSLILGSMGLPGLFISLATSALAIQ